jgi:hypothetical protein
MRALCSLKWEIKNKWSNLRGFGRMKNEPIKRYTGIRVEGQQKFGTEMSEESVPGRNSKPPS